MFAVIRTQPRRGQVRQSYDAEPARVAGGLTATMMRELCGSQFVWRWKLDPIGAISGKAGASRAELAAGVAGYGPRFIGDPRSRRSGRRAITFRFRGGPKCRRRRRIAKHLPDYALASAFKMLGRTKSEHTVFAGVFLWRVIRCSSRKASARPVSPRFTEPKSNVMRRWSNGASPRVSNVLGVMAPIAASSRAARGVYSSVTRVAGRPLSKRKRSWLQVSCRCASGSRRSTWSRNRRTHFQYRTRSTPRRHRDGRLDDEAQTRSRAGA